MGGLSALDLSDNAVIDHGHPCPLLLDYPPEIRGISVEQRAAEFLSIVVRPPYDDGVGNRQAPLAHHLSQTSEAEREAQIPPHTQNNDFAAEVPTLEQLIPAREHCLSTGLQPSAWARR
jgi:hypothetical protein